MLRAASGWPRSRSPRRTTGPGADRHGHHPDRTGHRREAVRPRPRGVTRAATCSVTGSWRASPGTTPTCSTSSTRGRCARRGGRPPVAARRAAQRQRTLASRRRGAELRARGGGPGAARQRRAHRPRHRGADRGLLERHPDDAAAEALLDAALAAGGRDNVTCLLATVDRRLRGGVPRHPGRCGARPAQRGRRGGRMPHTA